MVNAESYAVLGGAYYVGTGSPQIWLGLFTVAGLSLMSVATTNMLMLTLSLWSMVTSPSITIFNSGVVHVSLSVVCLVPTFSVNSNQRPKGQKNICYRSTGIVLWGKQCNKIIFGWGSAPDPSGNWEAYIPNSLNCPGREIRYVFPFEMCAIWWNRLHN